MPRPIFESKAASKAKKVIQELFALNEAAKKEATNSHAPNVQRIAREKAHQDRKKQRRERLLTKKPNTQGYKSRDLSQRLLAASHKIKEADESKGINHFFHSLGDAIPTIVKGIFKLLSKLLTSFFDKPQAAPKSKAAPQPAAPQLVVSQPAAPQPPVMVPHIPEPALAATRHPVQESLEPSPLLSSSAPYTPRYASAVDASSSQLASTQGLNPQSSLRSSM